MTRKIASRSAAIAFLVLGALTGVAQAEPVELTEAQMDQVSAGAFRNDQNGYSRTLRRRSTSAWPRSTSAWPRSTSAWPRRLP